MCASLTRSLMTDTRSRKSSKSMNPSSEEQKILQSRYLKGLTCGQMAGWILASKFCFSYTQFSQTVGHCNEGYPTLLASPKGQWINALEPFVCTIVEIMPNSAALMEVGRKNSLDNFCSAEFSQCLFSTENRNW